MKKQTLIIFGFLYFLISCNQAESKNKKIAEITTEKEKVESESTFVTEPYFENDSLTSALKSGLEKIALDPKFEIRKKKSKIDTWTI